MQTRVIVTVETGGDPGEEVRPDRDSTLPLTEPCGTDAEVVHMGEPDSVDWQALRTRYANDPLLDARITDRERPATDETGLSIDPLLVRWWILRDSTSAEVCRKRLAETWAQAETPSVPEIVGYYRTLRRLITPTVDGSAAESLERILDWMMFEECTLFERKFTPAEFVESVFEAVHFLNRNPTAHKLLQEFCEVTVAETKLPLAWIALRSDDDSTVVTLEGRAGEATAYLDGLEISLQPDVPAGQGPVALAIRTGEIQIIREISQDLRFRPWRVKARNMGFESMAALPIRLGEGVVGALALYARQVDFFNPARLQVATELATAVGLKLEDLAREASGERLMRFYRATRAIHELISSRRPAEEVIQSICHLAVEETGVRLAYFVNVDPRQNQPEILHAAGPGRGFLEGLVFSLEAGQSDAGISALVQASRAPVLINRLREDPRFKQWQPRLVAHGLASAAAFPVGQERDELAGIMVFLADEPDFFNPALVEHLAHLTRNLNLVIEDESRQIRLKRLERFYTVLAEIGAFLATDPPVAALIQKACDLACAAADLPVAYVTLIDPFTHTVRLEAFSGPASAYIQHVPISVDPSLPEGCGITGTVYRTHRHCIVNLDDPDSIQSVWLSDPERDTTAAIAGIPLLVGDRCLGVLGLGATTSGFFDEELTNLLLRIAESLSVGLGRQEEKTERTRFENLYHALADIYRLIVRHPRPELLYQEICQALLQLPDIAGIGIFQIIEPPSSPAAVDHAAAPELSPTPITSPSQAVGLPEFCRDLARLAALRHEPMLAGTSDAPALPEPLFDRLARSGLREVGAFPVLHRGRTQAILVVTSREAGYFKPETTTRLYVQVTEAVVLALTGYEREQDLRLMAFTDALTHLPNRNLFSDRLDSALKQAERTQTIVGVGILDVDHFKEINDRFGHDAGDLVLMTTARRLEATLNRESTVARLAGDEFGLILTGLHTETEITSVLERLRTELSQPIRYRGSLLPVTASLGVTLYPQDPVPASTLLRHADLALYRAKARGRNAWALYEEHFERLLESRIMLHSHLKAALQSERVESHLQPVVDLATGKVVSAELLARWQDPLSNPGHKNADWLTSIEDDPPLLLEAGRYLLNALGCELRALDRQGITLPLSLNVNLRYLLSPQFTEGMRRWMQEYGAYANRVILELKPSAALAEWNQLPDLLEEIRQQGVMIVLDNFGTWPISLRKIRNLHSHGIKIDRDFLLSMNTDPRAVSLVAGAVRSGELGGYAVTAVGIETLEQAELYLGVGGKLAQGFALAPVMPRPAFLKWMALPRHLPPELDGLKTRIDRPDGLPLLLSRVHHRWYQVILKQAGHLTEPKRQILFSNLDHEHCPCIPASPDPQMNALSVLHEALHARLAELIQSGRAGPLNPEHVETWMTLVGEYEKEVHTLFARDSSAGRNRTEPA